MGAERPRRRFHTTRDIEAARGGQLVLGPRDVLTDEARQRAMDLGVVVVRASDPPPVVAPPVVASPAVPSPQPASAARLQLAASPAAPGPGPGLREAVLAALRAELGQLEGLEQLVDEVLAREGL